MDAGASSVGPLDGITVVSLEQAVAAPFASRQLADLGARVIKIERPGSGDFARNYDETVKGLASHFVWLNRSKESLTLDLKSESGREVLARLLETADVFIQNLAPGAASRLGFGARELRNERPELVTCDISGYGTGGPYERKKAYDLLVQCEAGLLSVTGTEETPSKVGISVADIAAGMYAYSGILSALFRRERTGEGASLEVSLLEALAEWMGFPAYFTMYNDRQPPRTGASHAAIAPYGPYSCAGGDTVFLGLQNEREWHIFCERVLQRPEVATDERFASNSLRVMNGLELDREIEATLGGFTVDEAVGRLDEAGIANAKLRDVRGLLEHPQLTARNRWRVLETPAGAVDALIPPATISGHETGMRAVPRVGEHTETLLQELGYSKEEVSSLRDSGAI
ncbi:MAG: CaiB/BaiF CoA transferase family protein [Rubrobacter sp.]